MVFKASVPLVIIRGAGCLLRFHQRIEFRLPLRGWFEIHGDAFDHGTGIDASDFALRNSVRIHCSRNRRDKS